MAVARIFKPLPYIVAVVNNNNIEMVENCVYLSSQLYNEGGLEADMKRRIALAGVTFHKLREKVLKTHKISLAIKKLRRLNVRLCQSCYTGAKPGA